MTVHTSKNIFICASHILRPRRGSRPHFQYARLAIGGERKYFPTLPISPARKTIVACSDAPNRLSI